MFRSIVRRLFLSLALILPLTGVAVAQQDLLLPQITESNAADVIVFDPVNPQLAASRSTTQTSLIRQVGSNNVAMAAILQSPGSSTDQLQVGALNTSAAGILGGAGNGIHVEQLGARLDSRVVLINSFGTNIRHLQSSGSADGGVLVINGRPGMTLTLR